jgi:ATP-dependent helicase/nuclease subunit B
MKLATFPVNAAFLPALAQAWLSAAREHDEPASEGLIILPNRRAARALAAAFLPANQGKALLLPRIIAPGAIDEAWLTLAGGLALPQAIPVLMRQAILARLILALGGQDGAPRKLPAALALAHDLGDLLDEAHEAGISLASALPGLVPDELASHWQKTLRFLEIVTRQWPQILAELGMLDPAARQIALIEAQAGAWSAQPPRTPVWLVSAGDHPALARLAAVVARMPRGAVILPGHDAALPAAAWEGLEETHPASGIAQLLTAFGARREEVELWPAAEAGVPAGRARLLSQALLPASELPSWQKEAAFDLSGIYRLSAADEQSEALAIAMILRDALERQGATAALVTPDRDLAVRVAAALKRFGIIADDSAGEKLEATPPAVFLRLLAAAAIAEYAPLPMLALLKHPFSAAGKTPEAARAFGRALEWVLRGPRPSPGFDGIKFRLDELKADQPLRDFIDGLELRLRPLSLPLAVDPAEALRRLVEAAEAVAETAARSGAEILWSGEAGTALSELLLEAIAVLENEAAIAPPELTELLRVLLQGHVIRKPRSKDGHPRVAIWGVQEAALQTVDTVVLGGLVEGVWPALPEPGPWLSRPMRKSAGLPPPERQIGSAAHQFFSLSCACREVVLSAPLRRQRQPAVPARWLTRLEALLSATGQSMPAHPAAFWAARVDMPERRIFREKPAPRPASVMRPKTYSLTDIATLMANPYAVYARFVLKLRELDPLDEESDPSLFGNIVHEGLAAFYSVPRDFFAPGAAAELAHELLIAMRGHRPRAALAGWWAARLERIAGWIIDTERERRASNVPLAVAVERSGVLRLGEFAVRGRADRIEKRHDGSLFIMDYKTGTPPAPRDVESGTAPQLPLEAVMAEAGAFGPDMQGPVEELCFWKLSGRRANGEDRSIFPKEPDRLREIIDRAATRLPLLLQRFDRAETPYLAKPHPGRGLYHDPYLGISRRGEWGGEADGEG